MTWAVILATALLAVLVYIAVQTAERIRQLAGELDALNVEVARTATLVSQAIAALSNTVPASDVLTASNSLKTTNDSLQAALPPVP